MSISRKLATICLTLGFLAPAVPVAAGDDDTIDPSAPATDGEGVGGKENAGKEETSSGGIQTWGGGPKPGELREDWQAWLQILAHRPGNPPPFPKDYPKVTDGAPSDPEGCIEAVQTWRKAEPGDDQTEMIKDVQVKCNPAG